MKKIKTMADLAALVGADDHGRSTVEAIKRRLYHDTECGISFGVDTVEKTRRRRARFVVEAQRGINGRCRITRYRQVGRAFQSALSGVPQALLSYMEADSHGEITRETFDLMAGGASIVHRHTTTLIEWDEPTGSSYTRLYFTGYAEGSDAELPSHYVALPATAREIRTAIAEADRDGCEEWDRANGEEE